LPKVFAKKNSAIWGQKLIFCSKMKNAWAFETTSYFRKFFQFFKEFHNSLKWSELQKCVEQRTPPNAIKYKFKKLDLGNSILKYDALKLIWNENIKRPRNFGGIQLKIVILRNFFSAIFGRQYYIPIRASL
jgi:hypothetical protein